MSLPYYKRFPRDFLDGTIGLSFEEKGAYAIVLDLIYMRDGRLEDDARYVAGQLGCSVRKWTAIRDSLAAKRKLTIENGIISNLRANYLLEDSIKFQDKQREIAKKPRNNNDIRQPEPKPKQSQSESEPEIEGTDVPSIVRSSEVAFDVFWEAYPLKVGKRDAAKSYARALKRVGGPDPPGALLAGVDRAKGSRRWIEGYVPNPATWLNQDRWLDEEPATIIPIGQANGRPDHNPRRSPALDKLLDIDAAMVAAVQQSAGGYRGG